MSPGLADLNRPRDMRGTNPLTGILTATGFALIAIGVILSLKIFFGILGVINEPGQMEERLVQWEEVLGWDHEPVVVPIEIAELSDTNGDDAAPTVTVTVPVKWNVGRIAAAVLLVFLVFGLTTIALGILGGGVRILTGLLQRTEVRKLIDELEKRRKKSDGYASESHTDT